jgi:hypothetical protein
VGCQVSYAGAERPHGIRQDHVTPLCEKARVAFPHIPANAHQKLDLLDPVLRELELRLLGHARRDRLIGECRRARFPSMTALRFSSSATASLIPASGSSCLWRSLIFAFSASTQRRLRDAEASPRPVGRPERRRRGVVQRDDRWPVLVADPVSPVGRLRMFVEPLERELFALLVRFAARELVLQCGIVTRGGSKVEQRSFYASEKYFGDKMDIKQSFPTDLGNVGQQRAAWVDECCTA